jgi:hypothetical protein
MPHLLPHLDDLADLGITWLIGIVLVLAGSLAVGRRVAPEARLVVGWGVFCLVLTLWGVFTPLSLAIPAIAVVGAACVTLLVKSRRPTLAEWQSLARINLVALPFWLVMAPIRPAEPDTWLNLLPNAVYLVDHNLLPMAGRPDAHSFLPAAPYATQFLAYLGGLIRPDYPAAGMSLVNLLLLLTAGGLIGRVLIPPPQGEPLGWRAAALGMLLATGLNPGFVPRIHLSAYGETGLAVTALVAGILLVDAERRRRDGLPRGDLILAVGLVLAAMVGVKQSGFGMVAATAFGAGVPVLWARGRVSALGQIALALLLPVFLFLVWRGWVQIAGVDELKPLPFAQWQWGNLPAILGGIRHAMADKGLYFGLVALALAALPLLRRFSLHPRDLDHLAFHAALFVGYFLFLLLTYIGHFPGAWSTEAHSFFRYETQLSLVLVLALGIIVREFDLLRHVPARAGAIILFATALVAPSAAFSLLRFDRTMPQPLVWGLADEVRPYLKDGDRLALLLPGDNGSVATMLGGILNDTAPARKSLDLWPTDHADAAALDEAARRGYDLALISCTPPDLLNFSPHKAVLARHSDGEWRRVAEWSYPVMAAGARWQQILSWQPLCRAS